MPGAPFLPAMARNLGGQSLRQGRSARPNRPCETYAACPARVRRRAQCNRFRLSGVQSPYPPRHTRLERGAGGTGPLGKASDATLNGRSPPISTSPPCSLGSLKPGRTSGRVPTPTPIPRHARVARATGQPSRRTPASFSLQVDCTRAIRSKTNRGLLFEPRVYSLRRTPETQALWYVAACLPGAKLAFAPQTAGTKLKPRAWPSGLSCRPDS